MKNYSIHKFNFPFNCFHVLSLIILLLLYQGDELVNTRCEDVELNH